MAEIQWWYARGDEQFGPVSAAELRRLASTGGLAPGDLVRREGLAEWAPAARLKGLFPEAPAAPRDSAPAARPDIEAEKPALVAAAVEPPPPIATQETAELPAEPPSDPAFASFIVVDQPPVEVPPPPPPAEMPKLESTAVAPAPRPRISHLRLIRILRLVQGLLWATCVLVILFGGLVFTWARLKAKSPADEAASATIFSMFFIGAYVVARAGEKISQLVLAHLEQRRG